MSATQTRVERVRDECADEAASACTVAVEFHMPLEALRPYFTTFYHVDVNLAESGVVVDHLHPEWANLRLVTGSCPDSQMPGGDGLSGCPTIATGPSDTTVRFSVGTMRMWGIGLLPLGWAKFVGTPASEMANRIVDASVHPAFREFRPLVNELASGHLSVEEEIELITSHFLARLDAPVPDQDRIVAIHAALVDPAVETVANMVDRVGASQRTIERTCARAFGFSPKVLLRRQRFMRSLAQFMLDPTLNWIGALDSSYHDQAQFVRDFHRFMGMSPSQYASQPHPILGAIMRARAAFAGSAVQALDPPRSAN